jgi:predicted GNAT family acetyltransferase
MADDLVLERVNDTLFTATLNGVEVGRASLAIGDGVWEFYTTVTAPPYEGRGIASRLVRFALDAADAAGVTVIPSCWYVDGWMQRHERDYGHLRHGAHVASVGSAEDPRCRIAPAVLPHGR